MDEPSPVERRVQWTSFCIEERQLGFNNIVMNIDGLSQTGVTHLSSYLFGVTQARIRLQKIKWIDTYSPSPDQADEISV